MHRALHLGLGLLPCLAAACGQAAAREQPPSIILIIVDTLRADVLISRRDLAETPNIDALAADGVPFT